MQNTEVHITEALVLIIGYLLGSIPTAYIVGKLMRGVDIRKVGGGNMGALNAAREINPGIGLLVLMIDAAKGAGAILVAKYSGVEQLWIFGAGLLAVAGHCWPIWLKFRGGKGAATAMGAMLALTPLPFLCSLPIMVAIILLTSNVTLGMTGGFIFLPVFIWLFDHSGSLVIFSIVMALFLALRYVPTAKRGIAKSKNWKEFIIEKNYKPWQSRRK